MSPIPEFLSNAVQKIFFRCAIVTDVEALTGHFRLVTVAGPALIGETWIPGQKVQFHLGNLVTRTYTPTAWNPDKGIAQFLMFLHGNGPGSDWAASLQKGDPCQFIGPRSSLNFADIKGPSLFFGDETSIGAAQALASSNTGNRQAHYVFEVSSSIESEEVLRRAGLTNTKLVQRTADETHLHEVDKLLASTATSLGLPQWILTGRAQSIQTLRKLLRARRMLFSKLNVKAYWANGKTGLD
ncbi:siderophore-interacting protein [Edaphobacter dinghuensis]|uniref:FAD-binding FR-type domain-containing protein n=1 Tax=Edaphobacter dinghuensis TaxID=1560005 RepID=A0A917HU53_9BACT|nr:siderophore-interacting protein [Edaphobacter dinghuensis]GGG89142.1 hypothetical protein GCM10011585_36640 [Edaphobacter dinghuensis]